ncbi:MAG: hypothetical protein A2W25_09610 [candidate division Zixibacteria bacterium RBG_16_53_22]|nr:MAG: hypothetical protein A2W25_09610 [candidate division Zixibacteria bacterium RBG_16_53_22]
MQKRQDYVALELASEKLDDIIAGLRDKLLREFWSHVPEGEHREQISARLEDSILSALTHSSDNIEAT